MHPGVEFGNIKLVRVVSSVGDASFFKTLVVSCLSVTDWCACCCIASPVYSFPVDVMTVVVLRRVADIGLV